jgi:hypothetical protein
MPRYFFALTDKDNLSLAADEVGEEFDLVEAARGHATAVARELSRNVLKRGKDRMAKRHVAQKSPANWYRTIDRLSISPHRRSAI